MMYSVAKRSKKIKTGEKVLKLFSYHLSFPTNFEVLEVKESCCIHL